MKSLVTLGTGVVIILLMLSLYYHREVGELLDSKQAADEGALYAFYDVNFKNADSWNAIWFFIFAITFLLIMIWFDIRILRFCLWLKNNGGIYNSFVGGIWRWRTRIVEPVKIRRGTLLYKLFVGWWKRLLNNAYAFFAGRWVTLLRKVSMKLIKSDEVPRKKYNEKFYAFFASRWARPLHIICGCVVVGLIAIVGANAIIVNYGNARTVGLKQVKDSSVVMIPGTSKYMRASFAKGEKKINLYYQYRIDAAKELWENHKVKAFLVSGDRTGEQNYDETRDIKSDLMAFGVPEAIIALDTSGLRTHDSMVALRAFCSKMHTREAVIVSQAFQNRRALFMAPFFGISSQGFSAKGSPTRAMAFREFLGKPKVLIDLFITNKQPKETSGVEFRERFEVKTQDHLMVMICGFLSFMFTIVFLTMYYQKNEVVSMV